VHIDRTGFPLIGVAGLNYLIAWLPVTKIQFEHYLCDTNMLDAGWYQEIRDTYTPRISPGSMTSANYWNIFMTGILPAEALHFADWMGREFRLPTAQEWKEALTVLAGYRSDPEHLNMLEVQGTPSQRATSERAMAICRRLDQLTAQEVNQLAGTAGRRLCDQMLMRLGVVEYVFENNQLNSFGGWGQANRHFVASMMNPIRDAKPARLFKRAEGARSKQFGFRLIRDLP
jgi:hypothetical protein